MALSIGIVGLPNVGKSTLFNALTKAQNAQAANYPFCTIEPNKATVAVPDKRVDALTAKARPQKTIHASVDFIDIAGLVRGASKGEGLGNQFLANIRECAAIVEVVRCFEDENITHVDGAVDPLRDIDTIETELLLADIQSVEKRLEKLLKMAKGSKDAKAAAEIMQQLLSSLNDGKPASAFPLPENEAFLQSWRELGLLTSKPVIYCANVDENAVADGNELSQRVQALAEERHAGFARICAKLEVSMGVVKTAYANGASNDYMREHGIEVVLAKTGVKHLHPLAEKFDVGMYFEANGHGTVLFKPAFIARLRGLDEAELTVRERRGSDA